MSFSQRYLITLISNLFKSGINFYVSLLIAKYLLPEQYGDFQYILSTTTSIFIFVNMSTGNAYYTFISQKKQCFRFHLTYFVWQGLQFLIATICIIFLNQTIYQSIFSDFDARLVFLAFAALFFVNNVQNTVNYIIESIRMTQISQGLSIVVSLVHLVLVFVFIQKKILSITILFQMLVLEYFTYTLIVIFLIKNHRNQLFSNEKYEFIITVKRFYSYSKPLILFMFFSFVYKFLDRWLIQNYVGSRGQAFFSISMQFSTLTILITSSILKIFWKEISESIEQNDINKTKRYFQIVSKNLFAFTCIISTTLFFFSNNILNFFYSETYSEAALVFKLIMLYPIVQSMGQLYSVFLLGTEQTKLYRNISLGFLVVGIIFSIVVLSKIGLKMGVEGIAIKLLVIDLLSIICLEYYIQKYLKADFMYLNKFKIFIGVTLLSYIVYKIHIFFNFHFLIMVATVSLFYIIPSGFLLFRSLKHELEV